MSRSRSSASPSPRAKVRTMLEWMQAPVLRASQGTTSSCSMGRSSDGGPGSRMTSLPPSAGAAQPGAVPTLLAKAWLPRGNQACLYWFSPTGRSPKYSRSLRRLSASSSSGRPRTRATVSLVRSSLVGPRPPVVMTRSLRCRAARRHSSRRAALSPTTQAWCRSMPREERARATWAASVLMVWPSKSSVPTEMISAFMRCSLSVGMRRGGLRR